MLLTSKQQQEERLRSLARTFARANTTLVGRKVTVTVDHERGIKAPAYSVGDDITINLAYVGTVDTTDDIIKVTGLDFHELAHAEYTPRRGSWLVNAIQRDDLWQVFNMLEDQRIETLLVAKYRSLKPYFVMAVMQYIAAPGSDLGTAHALTYGRKYLPTKVRDYIRDRFDHPQILAEVEAIIDEYRTLVFPDNDARGLVLCREMGALLRSTVQRPIGDPFGHSSKTRPDGQGDPHEAQQQKAQKDAQSKVPDSEKKDAEEDDDYMPEGSGGFGRDDDEEGDDHGDGADTEDDTDGDDGDGGGDGSADGDDAEGDDGDGGAADSGSADDTGDDDGQAGAGGGDGEDGEGGEFDDADDDGLDDDDSHGSGNGTGDDRPKVLDDDELRQLAEDVAKTTAARPDVQRDAHIKKEAIKRVNGDIPKLRVKDYTLRHVSSDYVLSARSFKRELMKLWADADPGWYTHKASGRVNVGRAMRGGEIDTLFDQWNEGNNDATSLEMVVLFDYSFSMRRQMEKASQALWAIKRAVESIGGEVTVIGFSDRAYTFYDKTQKADRNKFRNFGAGLGTKPTEALEQARLIMHYSKKVHRIVLFLTDGDWEANWGGVSHNKVIEQFKAHGVMTALAYLGDFTADQIANMTEDDLLENFHGVHTWASIHDPKGLVNLAQGIVKQAMLQPVR